MKRIALFLAVLAPVTVHAAGLSAPILGFGADPEIQKLHREIAAAKLDRALNLTHDQAGALLPLLKEAQKLHGELRADHERRRPEVIRALTTVRDEITRTGTVSEASRKALLDARGVGTHKETREKMKALHEKAKQLLTPEQKSRMRDLNVRPIDDLGELAGGSGPEDDKESGPHHGPPGGRGPHLNRRHRMVLMIATSPEFVALVEARAR